MILHLGPHAPISINHPSPIPPPSPGTALEVRDPAVITPVPSTAPPERLRLGPADLAGLWVLVALELGRGAAPHAAGGDLVGAGRLQGRLHPAGCRDVPGRGGRGRRLGLLVRQRGGVGEAVGDGTLEALELGLLLGGEAGWRGGVLEGGGVGAGGCCRRRCE